MNNFVIDLYKKFQALSLDIVAGAIIFSLSVGKYYKVQIPLSVLLCLSISIWLIYTFDHIIDAQKIKGEILMYRHKFHKKHQNVLITLFIFLLFVGILNACLLPVLILHIGLVIVLLICIYFFALHKTSLWAKEFFIAILYTLGIFIAPISLCYSRLTIVQSLLIPEIFLLVLSNLLLFSWFDFIKDKASGFPSIAIKLGLKYVEKVIKILLTIGVLYCITILFIHFDKSTIVMQAVLLTMYSFLIFIFKYDQLFRTNDSYRIIGDGIFFIPIIVLLIC